jgi:hypothetical protein
MYNVTGNMIRVFKSRRTKWAGHMSRIGDMRNAFIIIVEKHEGKTLLGRNTRRV